MNFSELNGIPLYIYVCVCVGSGKIHKILDWGWNESVVGMWNSDWQQFYEE